MVTVQSGSVELEGDLALPPKAAAVVVFAHGSGSSRHSSRNKRVAARLQQAGFGTLLFDLLTAAEERIDERTAELRFDIGLLAERLEGATQWLRNREESRDLKLGYFGASTGAAAALVAAAHVGNVAAVVSRGGRPDLAGRQTLRLVTAPTLLIVGGRDTVVIELNQAAHDQLRCERRLAIVEGATHLFEEPGTLDQVADLSAEWFGRYM